MSTPPCSASTASPTLVDVLRRRSLEQPNQEAFAFLLGGEIVQATLTYEELDRQARALAAHLQSLGLVGERTLLLFPPGLEYVVAFFGCLYAGVAAVPAYPPRRNRSLDRLQAVVRDAGAAAVLSTPAVFAGVQREGSPAAGLQGPLWVLTGQVAPGAKRLAGSRRHARHRCAPPVHLRLHSRPARRRSHSCEFNP